MWEQWKERLKNVFTKEVEVEETIEVEVDDPEPKSEVKAKMTYQYPSRSSFKFPVIPDETEKNQTKHQTYEPAYKKRQTQRIRREKKEKQDQEQTYTYRQSNNSKQKEEQKPSYLNDEYKKTDNIGRKVYKKNPDIPFQPTDVPSPIYGYQRRYSTSIDDIPAFQRKKEEQLHDETEVVEERKENTVEKHLIEEAQEQDLQTSSLEIDSDEDKQGTLVNSKPPLVEIESFAKDEVASTEEPAVKQKKDKQTNDKKLNPVDDNQSNQAYRKHSQKKMTPFNVMMTPRDKKNVHEQKKREQVHSRLLESQRKREAALQQAQQKLNTINESKNEPNQEMPTKDEKAPVSIPYHLLDDPIRLTEDDSVWLNEQRELLEETLKHFQVKAKVVRATQGPSVTRFEVQPEMGVKVSKIKNLADDLKLNMSAQDIRIEAPIPGKNTVGIEIPNRHAEMVGLQSIFESTSFKESKSPLSIALGLTIEGNPKVTNIQKMPHGLIAGATGSGKSVCINTILISLIYKASHEDVKFLLIDPKMVELAPYNGIPHLVSPVITDVKAATQSLKWAVNEMEDRYDRFVKEGVRDIERYNQKMIKQGRTDKKMPFIVIVIDELADLMMMSPQDVEDAISRIAQKARACGIHLLLATQRPSVDVITGLIKANIPTRIAFSVSSQVDSRTIIDLSGAEKLLGKGDMLFVENGAGKSVRLQGPFVSDDEIERVATYARSIAEPNYLFEQEELLEQITVDEEDELLQEAISFVIAQNGASTSLLQRHFKIGYNRAARLIDSLESRGIISGQNGSKPREILISRTQADDM
ncbi:DNA translocase FtsK [Oceanobacillus kimchii]|uniref:DNA translocase FtsK n=1 Tax=Oceanobacillus kimchii TaxID=746691 RepID=UPI00232AEC38|nr:DNA translocase FtsK [Oceanobacillus kimchii]